MRHPVVLIAALSVLATGSLAPAAAQDAPETELTRTNVRYFVPIFQDGVSPDLTVTAEERGSCFSGSTVDAGRPDAWRCMAGNQILDPCFASPFALPDEPGVLVCAETPFTSEVVQFTPTEALPEAAANRPDAAPLPWALELVNGEQCAVLGGATFGIAGMRVNYGCPGGSLVGDVDRGLPVWAVSYLANGAVATDLVDVTVAWF